MFRVALFGAVMAGGLALGLVACATENLHGIPSSASMVAGGQDRISYRAPADGTVYVYDRDSQRLVYSGQVHSGQLIEVNPAANRITIEGRTAMERGFTSGDHLDVYFDRGAIGGY